MGHMLISYDMTNDMLENKCCGGGKKAQKNQECVGQESALFHCKMGVRVDLTNIFLHLLGLAFTVFLEVTI